MTKKSLYQRSTGAFFCSFTDGVSLKSILSNLLPYCSGESKKIREWGMKLHPSIYLRKSSLYDRGFFGKSCNHSCFLFWRVFTFRSVGVLAQPEWMQSAFRHGTGLNLQCRTATAVQAVFPDCFHRVCTHVSSSTTSSPATSSRYFFWSSSGDT